MIFLGKLSIILLSSDSASLGEPLKAKEVKRGRATCHRCKKTAQSRLLTAAPRVKQGCKDDAEERFPS